MSTSVETLLARKHVSNYSNVMRFVSASRVTNSSMQKLIKALNLKFMNNLMHYNL